MMELCVRFSKNMSELNGSGVVLCLRSRCSQTGSPTANPAARNHGVKNPIDLQSPLANLEILAQAFVEGPAGIHQKVVHARAADLRCKCFDMRVHLAAVFVGGIFGRDFERFRGLLEVVEKDGIAGNVRTAW